MADEFNPRRVVINFSASGDNTLVAAIPAPAPSMAAPFINIWEFAFVVAGATTLTFKDGAGAITGPMSMLANGSIAAEKTDTPHFIISPTQAFVLNSSAGVQIGGWLIYST